MQLHEQYRPRTWADVVGQGKIVEKIDTLRKRGLAGRAYWLSGISGSGKTTIARLIAGEVADEFSTDEIDAEGLTPIKVQELERSSYIRGMGSLNGRAIVINEAHGLKKATIRQLLVTLERVSPHAVWLFTTTADGQESMFDDCVDAHPLLSRCVVLGLAQQGLAKVFAARAQAIAQAEGLGGSSFEECVKLLKAKKNNMRAALQAIESGELLAA